MAWKGEALDPANLRAMCSRCHDAKTAHERLLGKSMKKQNGEERANAIAEFVETWRS
jgi:5-methylcytosine-specific restriction endonuclease McrA